MSLPLRDAAALARTGDILIFRGHRAPDRAIRAATNSPVNHVGMAVVLDDLPPLIWHAELGAKLPDLWTGGYHRGVQLHDLEAATRRWMVEYEQEAWLRQLRPSVGRPEEDGALRVVARMDGLNFPSTTGLAGRYAVGRVRTAWDRWKGRKDPQPVITPAAAFCAEVVASAYVEMGLLHRERRVTSYDPGMFWSGDSLDLEGKYTLGDEIALSL